MQDKLIIFLKPNESTLVDWVRISDVGEILESHFDQLVTDISEHAQDKEVIVLVPGEDVLLTTVKLPKMNRSRLLQALPFALEDQLIGDVESLHFVPAPEWQEHLPVAIVAKAKMEQWLAQLKTGNIKADRLMPAYLALPLHENTWSLLVLNHIFMLQTHSYYGFCADKHNLKHMLKLALSKIMPSPYLIYLFNASEIALAPTFPFPEQFKEESISPNESLNLLAKGAVKPSSINLLQGLFAVKKTKAERIKLKKISFSFAFVVLFLMLCYPTVSYFILKKRMNLIDQQMTEIYQRHFSDAKMVMPKKRLEEKLQKLSTQLGENRFLLLLGYVGKGLATKSTILLKGLEFQNNELTIELSANTSEDLTTFSDFLMQKGLSVKQQNVNLKSARINATLVIM